MHVTKRSYPNEDDGSPASSLVGTPVVLAGSDDTTDDKVAETHADSARDERLLAAPLVDVENGGDGGEEHDDADNTRSEERGRRTGQVELLEDERCVVEDDCNAT
jgi:hypothetical protein